MHYADKTIADCPIQPAQLDALVALVAGGQINGKLSKGKANPVMIGDLLAQKLG
jgi:Asp-tRNA(Asn)/Glu-tRNA(Gln) amidotransferase B subunit